MDIKMVQIFEKGQKTNIKKDLRGNKDNAGRKKIVS